jgi:drug/metabolite transporter (DMT)-like permease
MRFFSYIYSNAPLLLCLATLSWGSNTIVSRLAVDEVSPIMLVFLRWGMAMVIIAAMYGKEMRTALPIIRTRWRWVLVMGGVGMCCFNALLYIAAHTTTALNIGIVQSTVPGFILLGSYLIFGTRINLQQCAGLLITLLGGVVVVSGGSVATVLAMTFNSGDLVMLTACIFYAGFTLGLLSRPNVSSIVLMGFFSISAFLATFPMLAIEAATTGITLPSLKGWALILYTAIVVSFLSQVFFIRSVELIGAGAAGLYTNLVPVYAAILAVLLLNETLQIFHLAALALVFSGIYLFRR